MCINIYPPQSTPSPPSKPCPATKYFSTCNEETESHFRHMTREHIGQRKSTQWHEHELSHKPNPRS